MLNEYSEKIKACETGMAGIADYYAENVLDLAHEYAKLYSGCTKVNVGSAIVDTEKGLLLSLGTNYAIPNLCKSQGCLRVLKYGNNDKTHRNPNDCRAIHSEIDAIAKATKKGLSTKGTAIYITRYPCEACARAIVAAGIKFVIYGRGSTISQETQEIFASANIKVYHYSEWDAPDTTE